MLLVICNHFKSDLRYTKPYVCHAEHLPPFKTIIKTIVIKLFEQTSFGPVARIMLS